LALIVAVALSVGLSTPATADSPPSGFKIVRLKFPKVSIAIPRAWIITHQTPAAVRAERRRLTKNHPALVAQYDAAVKDTRSNRDKTTAFVAGNIDGTHLVIVQNFKPRQPLPATLKSSSGRQLKRIGWKLAKVDGRTGFRIDKSTANARAHTTQVMTMSHGRIVNVQVTNAGATGAPANETIVKSVRILDD
jgi:hypothetical protein